MSRLTPLFAATTLFAAIISTYLWQQLHTERTTTAQLRERVAQLELTQGRPIAGPAAKTDSADGQQKPVADQPASTGTPKAAAPPRAAAATLNSVALSINSRELMKDPDYREGMAMSLRASLAQNYPDLAKELDLTPEQYNKLLDLMTKNQVAMMADSLPEGADETAMRAAASARAESARKQEAEMAALLGDAKYQQYKDYQQTLGVRQQVTRLRGALESGGQPLSDQQQKQLIAALAANQRRQQEEARQMPRPATPVAPRDQVTMMEESLKRTEENNSRMVDTAAAYLNAQQLDAFRKMQNQNLAVSRAVLRAQRTQLEQGQGGQPGSSATSGAVVIVPGN